MVSVEKAKEILETNVLPLNEEVVRLEKACGRVLAEDIKSPIDQPNFDQSAMDGYALNGKNGLANYRVIGEIPAGSADQYELQLGEAVRIFTGAAVPKTANSVIQQELIERNDNNIQLTTEFNENKNIRPKGEQIRTGDNALSKGHQLNPGSIGFLAGLGITEVKVTKNPKIGLVITGNELVQPGKPVDYGQVYESNSIMLKPAVENCGMQLNQQLQLADDYEETRMMLKDALDKNDLLIITGGISVGDYDFVGKALKSLGVEELFYKVNQKPGKPLFFGKKEAKIVAALPGNPGAALTCFYMYVQGVINQLVGKKSSRLLGSSATLKNDYKNRGTKGLFLKAKVENNEAEILQGQSSAMLNAFEQANAFVYLDEKSGDVKKGETVTVFSLPWK